VADSQKPAWHYVLKSGFLILLWLFFSHHLKGLTGQTTCLFIKEDRGQVIYL